MGSSRWSFGEMNNQGNFRLRRLKGVVDQCGKKKKRKVKRAESFGTREGVGCQEKEGQPGPPPAPGKNAENPTDYHPSQSSLGLQVMETGNQQSLEKCPEYFVDASTHISGIQLNNKLFPGNI